MRTIWIIPGMFGLNVGLTFGHAKSGNDSSPLGFAKPVFKKVWTIVTDLTTRWEQRRQLKELPAYRLKDMGISPVDAAVESQKPFWR